MPSTTLLDIPPAQSKLRCVLYAVGRDMALCWHAMSYC
jgi:hypothetical protein